MDQQVNLSNQMLGLFLKQNQPVSRHSRKYSTNIKSAGDEKRLGTSTHSLKQ